MPLRPITPEEAREEVRWLEYHYGKRWLENTCDNSGIRWRALTGPHAQEKIARGDIKTVDLLP